MLGLTLTADHVYLRPLRSLPFELHQVRLAGVTLSVRVEAGWEHVIVSGRRFDPPARLPRDGGSHRVEFVNG
jgi:hypothetical protein